MSYNSIRKQAVDIRTRQIKNQRFRDVDIAKIPDEIKSQRPPHAEFLEVIDEEGESSSKIKEPKETKKDEMQGKPIEKKNNKSKDDMYFI